MITLPPILYVEDNENDIELTLSAFKSNKIKNPLIVVNDGEEVLNFLKYKAVFKDRPKENPVIILMDIKMPKVNGLEALEKIKSDQEIQHIPVIMLIASEMEWDLVKSYELGVNADVVKPIDYSEYQETFASIGSFWVSRNKTN